MAMMILFSNPIYDTIDEMLKDFKEKDLDNHGVIKLEDFNEIMYTYNTEEAGFNQLGEDEDKSKVVSEFD